MLPAAQCMALHGTGGQPCPLLCASLRPAVPACGLQHRPAAQASVGRAVREVCSLRPAAHAPRSTCAPQYRPVACNAVGPQHIQPTACSACGPLCRPTPAVACNSCCGLQRPLWLAAPASACCARCGLPRPPCGCAEGTQQPQKQGGSPGRGGRGSALLGAGCAWPPHATGCPGHGTAWHGLAAGPAVQRPPAATSARATQAGRCLAAAHAPHRQGQAGAGLGWGWAGAGLGVGRGTQQLPQQGAAQGGAGGAGGAERCPALALLDPCRLPAAQGMARAVCTPAARSRGLWPAAPGPAPQCMRPTAPACDLQRARPAARQRRGACSVGRARPMHRIARGKPHLGWGWAGGGGSVTGTGAELGLGWDWGRAGAGLGVGRVSQQQGAARAVRSGRAGQRAAWRWLCLAPYRPPSAWRCMPQAQAGSRARRPARRSATGCEVGSQHCGRRQ